MCNSNINPSEIPLDSANAPNVAHSVGAYLPVLVLNEAMKKEIADLAELQFTREEIGLITGVNVNEESVRLLIRAGHLKQEAVIRTAIFTLATQGSSPAQAMALAIIEAQRLRM